MTDGALSYGSLFSGIGGIDLGLDRAGWRCRWQIEADPYCLAVLEKHWPAVPKYEDIKTVRGTELEPVELVAGGFPCQPVSHVGKRQAQKDERWLWPEFARLLGELRPRYALVENVPGLRSRGFGDVLGDLARLGFDAEWASIPAAAVGAPHLRYRVFVIAYANGGRCEEFGSSRLLDGERSPFGHDANGRRREVADADVLPLVGSPVARPECHPWATEPDVGRVAHGVPSRVDRLRALGNACVPQVAEYVGRQVAEFAMKETA